MHNNNVTLFLSIQVNKYIYKYASGGPRVEDNILACGAGGPEFEPVSSVRLTSPSLARQRCLLNEAYNMM